MVFPVWPPANTFGMNWNADCEPGLISQYQCWTSLMLWCLNGSKSLQPGSNIWWKSETRRVEAHIAACQFPWLWNHKDPLQTCSKTYKSTFLGKIMCVSFGFSSEVIKMTSTPSPSLKIQTYEYANIFYFKSSATRHKVISSLNVHSLAVSKQRDVSHLCWRATWEYCQKR